MKTNTKILVWSFFGCLLLLTACQKRESDYVLGKPQVIVNPPPRVIPTHRVAEDLNYRLGKWARIFEPSEIFYADTLNFRTDSTMSWFISLGIQKYRFERNTMHYEWKDFVSPRIVWQYAITRFDTLNEILYVNSGAGETPYQKVR